MLSVEQRIDTNVFGTTQKEITEWFGSSSDTDLVSIFPGLLTNFESSLERSL